MGDQTRQETRAWLNQQLSPSRASRSQTRICKSVSVFNFVPPEREFVPNNVHLLADDVAPSHNQIVLHEDKRYYASANDTYGEGVEAMVQEEDAQPLTEPIVAPVKQRSFRLLDKSAKGPVTRFDRDFLLDLSNFPESVRNVAVVGHLHHGKTALMDMLVYETHQLEWDTERQLKYTDSHSLAISRNLSLKAGPMSLVMPTTKGKSHLLNLVDTPGHVNFLVGALLNSSSGIFF